jgi:hypothetical protein
VVGLKESPKGDGNLIFDNREIEVIAIAGATGTIADGDWCGLRQSGNLAKSARVGLIYNLSHKEPLIHA